VLEFFEATATVNPQSVGLNERRTWVMELTLGQDLPCGTVIYLCFLGMQRQRATLQSDAPGQDGYWRLECEDFPYSCQWYQLSTFEVLKVIPTKVAPSGATLRWSILEIPSLGKNMGLHLHAWESKPFPVFVRLPGADRLLRLRKVPQATIEHGPPAALRCYGPSTIRADKMGQPMDVRLAYLDADLNPVTLSEARLRRECACCHQEICGTTVNGLITAQVHACECDRVVIRDEERGLQAVLNPRRKIPPGAQHLFWGEIHSHAYVDDGTRSADYNYRYARNTACLDFGSLTIHDHFGGLVPGVLSQYTMAMWDRVAAEGYDWEGEFRALSDALADVPEGLSRWKYVLAKAEQYNETGVFVTIPGYEWTASTYRHLENATGVSGGHGHRCIYFNSQDAPLLVSRDQRYATPEKLFAALDSYSGRAMTVPHHPAAHPEHKTGGWTIDWDRYDPRFDRLVEVYSCHGSSEYPGNPRTIPGKCGPPASFVRSAIGAGCRLGIVAGTDNHEARPGQVDGGWGDSPGGMIGVWASELTRDSVFDALYERHCYGVSNMARIVLEFNLNGATMGSEVMLPRGARRHILVRVKGTTEIEDVQIIKNGKPWYSAKLRGNRGSGEISYVDDEPPTMVDSYYVTVTQKDGEMAWSSPIWVQAEEGSE